MTVQLDLFHIEYFTASRLWIDRKGLSILDICTAIEGVEKRGIPFCCGVEQNR